MPRLIHLIGAIVIVAFAFYPSFLLGWIAVGWLGSYLYTLHEELTQGSEPERANVIVLSLGALLTFGFALVGVVYGLMAAVAVGLVLAFRRILPKRFAELQSSEL